MREMTQKELAVNDQALELVGGIFSLINNIAGPLLGQVERNKKRIMDSKVDLAIKEDMIMRMTIAEIADYIREVQPVIMSVTQNAGTWRSDLQRMEDLCM